MVSRYNSTSHKSTLLTVVEAEIMCRNSVQAKRISSIIQYCPSGYIFTLPDVKIQSRLKAKKQEKKSQNDNRSGNTRVSCESVSGKWYIHIIQITNRVKGKEIIGVQGVDRLDPLLRGSSIVGLHRYSCGAPFGAHTRPILVGRGGTSRGPSP